MKSLKLLWMSELKKGYRYRKFKKNKNKKKRKQALV